MGHVTNGLTLAFNHLMWAKRKHKRRDRESACQKAMSEQHKSKEKWIKKKKISAAFYSEQTSDKAWQGQGEREQTRCGNLLQIHHTQAALIHLKEEPLRFPTPLSTLYFHLVASFSFKYSTMLIYIVDVELVIENNTVSQAMFLLHTFTTWPLSY